MTRVASPASEVTNQITLRWLTTNDWQDLRRMRLAALADSPRFFLGRYEEEASRSARWWQDKCSRGNWVLACLGKETIGLVGVTRCDDIPPSGRYIESLWITPAWRRFGLASVFICKVMRKLAADGVGSIWLWILDGNNPAGNLYKKLGFVDDGDPVILSHYTDRWETRMKFDLSWPLPDEEPGSLDVWELQARP